MHHIHMPLLAAGFAAALLMPVAVQARTITADMNATDGPRDMFWQDCVGSGHAGLLLRQENLDQLKAAHDATGFRYIRFHGIFSDDMGVYREDAAGHAVYDFRKVDQVYAALLKTGIRPFVELSFMPDALAENHKPIFYWKANGSPPKDMAKWQAFITAFTRHLVTKFGKAEVEQWRFEVWNEPNLEGFWNPATQQSYFALYDATVRAIKSVDAKLPVGGPATAGAAWVPEFLAHAKSAGVPVDFVTTHTYGVKGGFLDENGKEDNKLSADPDAITGDIRRVRQQVTQAGFPDMPVYFTEWNSSYSPRDPIHDTYFNAAYILEKLKGAEGELQSMSYWTYSDLFEEAGPPPTPFHGGFGLINREGIPKASFFAYKYLNELGPTRLKTTDPHAWLTRRGFGFAGLMWNFTTPDQKLSNRPYFTKVHPAKSRPPLELKLRDLRPGIYRLKVYRTGYMQNDPYTQYIRWGMPDKLSTDQIKTLKAETRDAPVTDTSVTIGADGRWQKSFPIQENAILLVKLIPVRPAGE